jgi:hypothetical protein
MMSDHTQLGCAKAKAAFSSHPFPTLSVVQPPPRQSDFSPIELYVPAKHPLLGEGTLCQDQPLPAETTQGVGEGRAGEGSALSTQKSCFL